MEYITRHTHGPTRSLTEDQIDEAVQDYNSGMTQKQVAEKFGVSLTTIRKYFRERRKPE